MNLSVNSIFQSKLNEIQSRIPNISEKSSNFAECLQKATDSNTESTATENISETQNPTNPADSLALLSLLSNNSMYNTSSLFSGDLTNNNSLSSLNTLLALQQYNNNN